MYCEDNWNRIILAVRMRGPWMAFFSSFITTLETLRLKSVSWLTPSRTPTSLLASTWTQSGRHSFQPSLRILKPNSQEFFDEDNSVYWVCCPDMWARNACWRVLWHEFAHWTGGWQVRSYLARVLSSSQSFKVCLRHHSIYHLSPYVNCLWMASPGNI